MKAVSDSSEIDWLGVRRVILLDTTRDCCSHIRQFVDSPEIIDYEIQYFDGEVIPIIADKATVAVSNQNSTKRLCSYC